MRTTWIICVLLIFVSTRETEPKKVDDQCLFLEEDRVMCPEVGPVWVIHKKKCTLAIRCRKGFTEDECEKKCQNGESSSEATTPESAETSLPPEVEETPEPPDEVEE